MAEHGDGACDGCEDEIECECAYPHGHDFEPYNFERCDCKLDCYHVTPLFPNGFPERKETK